MNGKKLKGPQNKVLEVARSDFAFTRSMLDCPCARQLEVVRSIEGRYRNKVTDLFGRYQCDKNGNYLPMQCSDTACYCVSAQNGYLLTDEESADVLSSALRTEPEKLGRLFCYQQYPEAEKARLRELLRLPSDLANVASLGVQDGSGARVYSRVGVAGSAKIRPTSAPKGGAFKGSLDANAGVKFM